MNKWKGNPRSQSTQGMAERWVAVMSTSPLRARLNQLDIFEVGSVKSAAQFSQPLLYIPDYVQMKYNNEVSKAI